MMLFLLRHLRLTLLILFQNEDGSSSSWSSVRALFDLEKSKILKKAPQLTLEHVQPSPARRMNVRLAAKVLSHRTASAMRSLQNELPASSVATADLLDTFNSIFDFLNSSYIGEVGSRRPALRQLWESQQEVRTLNVSFILGYVFLFLDFPMILRFMPRLVFP